MKINKRGTDIAMFEALLVKCSEQGIAKAIYH